MLINHSCDTCNSIFFPGSLGPAY